MLPEFHPSAQIFKQSVSFANTAKRSSSVGESTWRKLVSKMVIFFLKIDQYFFLTNHWYRWNHFKVLLSKLMIFVEELIYKTPKQPCIAFWNVFGSQSLILKNIRIWWKNILLDLANRIIFQIVVTFSTGAWEFIKITLGATKMFFNISNIFGKLSISRF